MLDLLNLFSVVEMNLNYIVTSNRVIFNPIKLEALILKDEKLKQIVSEGKILVTRFL